MRILLDECVDPRVSRLFSSKFDVSSVGKEGWLGLKNGELVRAASAHFDFLFTVDGNMRFQTNLKGIDIAVVVAPVGIRSVDGFQPYVEQFEDRAKELAPGEYLVLDE